MSRPFRLLLLLPLLLCLSACSTLHAETHPGEATLIREVATATGKSPARLEALLGGAQKQQSIIDAMNRPAESMAWTDYRKIFMTSTRVEDGIAFYREHQALLDRVSVEYGVPASYLVAILGVETNYGRVTGSYRVLDALVTLAFYYPPRADFFRKELKTLLELPSDKLAGPLDSLKGSYAGAQGWGQFMPSSIKAYAVDADHDGRIDLMDSLPDILASVANYFHAHGWVKGGPVVVRAQADDMAHAVKVDHSKPLYPVEQFEAWGYAPLAEVNPGEPSTLLSLDGSDGSLDWLTFQNFYVITRYNRSPMYAMVVHQLADAIAAGVKNDRMARAAR
ncbi:MAG TPA: lytic murein transglycosylase B [Rhodanobacteraceae bacterium]|nr:lytic murein transglycosylase B [Rhodanobacteraceae bacterium]